MLRRPDWEQYLPKEYQGQFEKIHKMIRGKEGVMIEANEIAWYVLLRELNRTYNDLMDNVAQRRKIEWDLKDLKEEEERLHDKITALSNAADNVIRGMSNPPIEVKEVLNYEGDENN